MTVQSRLQALLERHGAIAGTAHELRGDLLHLVAQVNIPPVVQERSRTIPCGKGMAGLAWERAAPVQTCNLKTDQTGDVQPGAKAVDAAAAVAIPVGEPFCGVIGLAFAHTGELPAEAVAQMQAEAGAVLD